MRAMVCRAWGAPEHLALADVPEPRPGASEVLIDVHACSVNFADILMVAGKYQTRPPLPFTPGLEAAGTVVEAPAGSGLQRGARVVAFLWHGGYAERAVASLEDTFRLPEGMSFEVGATLTSAYASTDLALRAVGRLTASEVLLVLGAGGGVGLAAVELGKAIGARVIAAASTAEKLGVARAKGADATLESNSEGWKDAVLALTDGRGVDVCLDPVGGPLFDAALSTLGWGGRYVIVGFASGQVQRIPADRLLVKHRVVLGSTLRYFRFEDRRALGESMAQLFHWYQQGKIAPFISRRLPLEETAAGLRLLADRRAIGKVVVHVR
jgi:NADPH:quinone reductase